MRSLKPFSPHSATVQASFERRGKLLEFKFELIDSLHQVEDSLTAGDWPSWPRAHDLWKTTCFEAFFGLPGKDSYWELNLSPAKKLWNLYRFDSYREPQPPRSSNDFDLTHIHMTETTLACTLTSKREIPPLEVSLTAVIKTAEGLSYFALQHAKGKPDFHQRETFR